MATNIATHALAKGPLASALGQWTLLGVGTFVLFTGDNGVSRAAQEIAAVAVRLVTGRNGGDLWREAALGHNNLQNSGTPQPIVIHSVTSDSKNYGGWTTTIIQLGLASGACWGAYIIFSNCLPEQLKELLPVTRKFFEAAVTSLGQGILKVREALEEKIKLLGLKQDRLGEKQDQTHREVLGLKDDVGDVRLSVDDIAIAISRCEESLTDAAGRQTYMTRGVRLLVQCVGDLLRPSNPTVAEELDQFSRLSSEMDDGFHYREAGGGGKSGALINAQESPSSINLSEIGSIASMDHLGDHHHHHHHGSRSVPRPRRPQPTLAHAATNTSTVPSSASKAGNRPQFLGMATPGKMAPRMLHSFGGSARGSDATATTASASTVSRSLSGYAEYEVPHSNYHSNPSSGKATPTALGESDAADPVPPEDVEELLRRVKRGGISPVTSPAVPAMRAH
ncbi:hypothetical protein ACHAXT_011321 [Thalassiosira profunda]